ncbi:beta-xylosidase/alpha-l-arabinosidase [Modestobacter sp. SYSU DS0511]
MTNPNDQHTAADAAEATAGWRNPARPLDERVRELMAAMTLEEKVAQLYGVWTAISEGEEVAPNQHEFAEPLPPWEELTKPGLGQLTRMFGTGPVEPETGARVLAQTQRGIVEGSRLGIPAIAHEECLTGFTAWQATVFPIPLAWGASFDAESVHTMARGIGDLMRSVGVHQGLSPVLDVSFDHRWGRTEETIGEDPYLVAALGTAYVRGLEEAGIVSTLKHFAGYSGSGAGRNHAPVRMGQREFRDVVLPPFETALREGGARSVMNSYAAVDGLPPAADPALMTDLLRGTLGFDGVVVADYFAVSFLETTQGVAGGPGEAAALALTAGIDVELPTVRCYGEPLLERIRSGEVPMSVVDTALERVLRQKGELGLLDAGWDPEPEVLRRGTTIDFDPPHMRALARTMAERSVVLLDNRAGTLPLSAPGKVAVVGPAADEVLSLMGCYAFPNHVGVQHPDMELGIELPTLLDAVRTEFAGAEVTTAQGCPVQEVDRSGIADAVRVAESADVVLAVLGDVAGLFGRGTSGEGCDADDLRLPGAQGELLDALLETGKPVVVVLLTGRPYALGAVVDRAAAIVQAFFPGEEGAGAVAGVLSGRVNPSGKLPVQVSSTPGGAPNTYLHAALGAKSGISAADPTPVFPFGHGLSYTSFAWEDAAVGAAELPSDGEVTVSVTVRNTGDRDGAEIVQLYLHDPVASVVRPVRQLVGFARVELAAGAAAQVTFTVHADRTSFTGRDMQRIVEPGDLVFQLGASSEDLRFQLPVQLTGAPRVVGTDRVLSTPVEVRPL